MKNDQALIADFEKRLDQREVKIAILGMGYVGLPLALAYCRAGFEVRGYDVDDAYVELLNSGVSKLRNIPSEEVATAVGGGKLTCSADAADLAGHDVYIVCVPTPIGNHQEPDLRYVESSAKVISAHLTPGALCVLESTTFPNTTSEFFSEWLESDTTLKEGRDFFVAYSPEREDPGNKSFTTTTIPKVVGADTPVGRELVRKLYATIVEQVISVSSASTAEAVKITENIFRSVNIALVNELKVIYDAMGLDVWEVLEAAATKPFGFMRFDPGPGIGGHCIPIDPYYLTWKAREYGIRTRFIELSGEVNESMPRYVVDRLQAALGERQRKSLNSARVLLLGIAYKPDVADLRESPGLAIMELLQKQGARVDFHDPYVQEIPSTRDHPSLAGLKSIPLERERIETYDACMVVTHHSEMDWALVADSSKLIIDTRNVMRPFSSANVVRA
jgi:UDP-N-acetyl-D-glucosamine dehydrogenase